MARRSASARPIVGLALRMSKVEVVSRVAAPMRPTIAIPTAHRRAGIEEGARQARQRLRAGLVAGGGVAGRQHHPVGIELELCTSLAVSRPSSIRGLRRDRERERRLAQPLHVAGDEPMSGEIDDAVIG